MTTLGELPNFYEPRDIALRTLNYGKHRRGTVERVTDALAAVEMVPIEDIVYMSETTEVRNFALGSVSQNGIIFDTTARGSTPELVFIGNGMLSEDRVQQVAERLYPKNMFLTDPPLVGSFYSASNPRGLLLQRFFETYHAAVEVEAIHRVVASTVTVRESTKDAVFSFLVSPRGTVVGWTQTHETPAVGVADLPTYMGKLDGNAYLSDGKGPHASLIDASRYFTQLSRHGFSVLQTPDGVAQAQAIYGADQEFIDFVTIQSADIFPAIAVEKGYTLLEGTVR